MRKKAVRILQGTCAAMFRILLIGSFLLLSVSGGLKGKLADVCSGNVITLIRNHGDGTGQYRLRLEEGSCTFYLPLAPEGKKGHLRVAEDGSAYYEIPGTRARLRFESRACGGSAKIGECMERDASYYKQHVGQYGRGYHYAGAGWMTRTEAFACHRFRMEEEDGENARGYAAVAVVYIRSKLAEYRFVLEAVSREEADLFGSSFVYTPHSD